MGTADPKQKQKLLALQTFFTTEENGSSVNDSDRDRIVRVNYLADSVGLDVSLEDEGGSEESFSAPDTSPSSSTEIASLQPVAAAPLKTTRPVNGHNDASASHRASLCNAMAELKGSLASSP